MTEPTADARQQILDRLRRPLAARASPFRNGNRHDRPPAVATAVTSAEGDPATLARLFVEKLEAAQGSAEIADAGEVASRVVRRLAGWRGGAGDPAADAARLLSWEPAQLPVAGLEPVLRDAGFTLVVPGDLHDPGERDGAAALDAGITGVDAAFASTGSVLLASGPGRSRAASLLPLHHILLVPLSRLFPTFESWLHRVRETGRLEAFVRQAGQLVFITGPSKSADIELHLTLGVHGPGAVHAVLFDDTPG